MGKRPATIIFRTVLSRNYERLLKSILPRRKQNSTSSKDKEIAQQQLQIAKEKEPRNRYIF